VKIFWKIYLVVFIAFMVIASAVGYFTASMEIAEAQKNILKENQIAASFISKQIETGYVEYGWPFESLSELAKDQNFLFWWIVKPDGVIYLGDKAEFIGMSAYDYYPELKNGHPAEKTILNRSQGYGIIIKPVEINRERWTFIQGFSLDYINTIKRRIASLAVVIFIIALTMLGFFLYYSINYLVLPLESLKKGAEAIGKGDLDYRVETASHDEIGELAGIFNQMTRDLKSSQEELVQAEKLSAIGFLAAGVAHELNNPLTGILNLLGIFRDELDPQTQKHEDVLNMIKAAEHMAKVINDLTSFARQTKDEFSAVDINDIVEATLSFSNCQLAKNKVKLIKDYGAGLQVWADKSRLQQVVLNMLANACDAMPEGGSFTIRTRLSEQGDDVIIEFIDTGMGIKKEDVAKIFTPFFTTKLRGKGTGLGLAVSYGIIKKHNGDITVTSEPGKGTAFKVVLPRLKKGAHA